MLYIDTNGTNSRVRRFTMLPPAPHPPGQGACSVEEPCDECAAADAVEDEPRDTVEDVSDE